MIVSDAQTLYCGYQETAGLNRTGPADRGGGFMTKRQSNFIKLIAIITMFTDHMGLLLFPNIMIFRIIGRIAFPLFAYQIGVSYGHTGNIKRYIIRLAGCAFIFQGFYVIAGFLDHTIDSGYLNIFFTLIVGLILIWLVDHRRYLIALPVFLIPVLLPYAGLTMDYGVYGIALILFLYVCRNRPTLLVSYLAVSAFLYCYATPGGSYVQMYSLLAAIFLLKPLDIRWNISGWFFYAFYPLHLAMLYGIQWLAAVY
jgi:hypothetical protein